MKTPITDAAAYPPAIFQDQAELVPADLARRLELDRAALMEALEDVLDGGLEGPRPDAVKHAIAALSTARANFP